MTALGSPGGERYGMKVERNPGIENGYEGRRATSSQLPLDHAPTGIDS